MHINMDGWKQPALPEFSNGENARRGSHRITDQAAAISAELFPDIVQKIQKKFPEKERIVLAFAGGSGAGKSDITSAVVYDLNQLGIFSYCLAGDNYPLRIPPLNDEERIRVFRTAGIKELIRSGHYTEKISSVLRGLWKHDLDSDPKEVRFYPWLSVYQKAGISALREYLGQPAEEDFDDINRVIREFRSGKESIWCKQLGRSESSMKYQEIRFPKTAVMALDWTHGLSPNLAGIDISVLLASTPEETKEIRIARARDSMPDSAFVTMVLGIEQASINERAASASIIIDRRGRYLSLKDFRQRFCSR